MGKFGQTMTCGVFTKVKNSANRCNSAYLVDNAGRACHAVACCGGCTRQHLDDVVSAPADWLDPQKNPSARVNVTHSNERLYGGRRTVVDAGQLRCHPARRAA